MKLQTQICVAVIAVALAFHFQQPSGPPDAPHDGRPKLVRLVVETADVTPDQARAIVNLRTGELAKRLADKGVFFEIVDDDATNERGEPVLDQAEFDGQSPPLMQFYSKRGGKLLDVEPLPKDFTAESVTSLAKKHGA